MIHWSKNRLLLTSQFSLFFLMSLFISPLLNGQSKGHIVLGTSIIVITVLSLFLGLIPGLIISLFAIFGSGSLLFYLHLSSSTNLSWVTEVDSLTFLFVSFALLILVSVAGSFHNRLKTIEKQAMKLHEQVQHLTMIDTDTGFDNFQRFQKDMQVEYSRALRYNETLSILLITIDYYEMFRKLYGEKELQHLIHSFSTTIDSIIRQTDKKYRMSSNYFALLLPHTPDDGAMIVKNKLYEQLKEHQLLSEKIVDLTLVLSIYSIDQDSPFTVEGVLQVIESELKRHED